MANSHSRSNCIDCIPIKGVCVEGEEEVKSGIAKAFKELLSDPGEWGDSIEG